LGSNPSSLSSTINYQTLNDHNKDLSQDGVAYANNIINKVNSEFTKENIVGMEKNYDKVKGNIEDN